MVSTRRALAIKAKNESEAWQKKTRISPRTPSKSQTRAVSSESEDSDMESEEESWPIPSRRRATPVFAPSSSSSRRRRSSKSSISESPSSFPLPPPQLSVSNKIPRLESIFDLEPQRVSGRQDELQAIRTFVDQHVRNLQGAGLYVCGMSGTGKTEAVLQVFEALEAQTLVPIDLHWISASTPKFLPHFIKTVGSDLEKPLDKLSLIVIDEMDLLPQTLFQSLFAWSKARKSKCILIGIANTVNLSSNTQNYAQEIMFKPYNTEQLLQLAKVKLEAHVLKSFTAEALELCARKSSARSGDLRSMCALCNQVFASAIATATTADAAAEGFISLTHVVQALAKPSMVLRIHTLQTQLKFCLVSLSLASRGVGAGEPYSAVSLNEIKSSWTTLRTFWKIPTDNRVEPHLDALVELSLVEQQGKTTVFQLLVNAEEILQGLLGPDFDGLSEAEKESANFRPILLAFKGIKRRMFANLHAVATL